LTDPPVWQTDRRTDDGRAIIKYSAHTWHIMLSHA